MTSAEIVSQAADRKGPLHKTLRRIALRHYSSGLAPDMDADDVVQTVLASAWQRAADGEQITSQWLANATRTQACNLRRSAATRAATSALRLDHLDVDDDKSALLTDRNPGYTPAHIDLLERLHEAIGQLPPIQQQIVQLSMMGFSAAEAGRKLGIAEPIGKLYLSRARATLKKILAS